MVAVAMLELAAASTDSNCVHTSCPVWHFWACSGAGPSWLSMGHCDSQSDRFMVVYKMHEAICFMLGVAQSE